MVVGYPDSDASWVTECDVQGLHLVTQFHNCYLDKPGGDVCQGVVPNSSISYLPGAGLVAGSRLSSPAAGLTTPWGGGSDRDDNQVPVLF